MKNKIFFSPLNLFKRRLVKLQKFSIPLICFGSMDFLGGAVILVTDLADVGRYT